MTSFAQTSAEDRATLQKSSMQLTDDGELINTENGFSGKLEIIYVNCFDREVFVADRHGAVVRVPASDNWTNHFHVRIARWYGNTSKVRLDRPVKEKTLNASQKDLELDEAIRSNFLERSPRQWKAQYGRTKDLHLKLSLEKLTGMGDVFYHPESDLVVALREELAVHPDAPMQVSEKINKPVSKEKPTAGVSVSIVDNTHKSTDRFVYFLGRIHRVKAKPNSRLEDGVYIKRCMSITDEGGFKDNTDEYHPLTDEVFKQLGLFKSYEDALNWVTDIKNDREIKLNESKTKLAETKVSLESDSLKRKDYYDDVGSERKDRYESNSIARKDSSDEFKWMLGVVGTVLGIAALVLKR